MRRSPAARSRAPGAGACSRPAISARRRNARALVATTLEHFGRIDVLVNNAAFQMSHKSLEQISAEEFDRTFRTNVYANFYLCRAAVPPDEARQLDHQHRLGQCRQAQRHAGGLCRDQGRDPEHLSGGMAQLLADKGIRVNCVAPGPILDPADPLDPAGRQCQEFGTQTPMKRPGQPRELQAVYVLLASDEGSYISGATIPGDGRRALPVNAGLGRAARAADAAAPGAAWCRPAAATGRGAPLPRA